MYIVKKKIKGKEYFYIRKSERKGDKVKSRNVAYGGKTREGAEKKLEKFKNQENKKQIMKIKTEKKIGNKFDEINSIASNRGFFFQTANIYGGKAGFFTFGHLGKQLRMNWENIWRKNILALDDNFFEIQSNNILPEEVFKASGHIKNFNDPMVECKKCHFRFRADNFLEDKNLLKEGMPIEEMQKVFIKEKLKCPKCGGELTEIRQFNMMFSVNIGFNEEKAYLSPETAQGAYITFKEEFQATRNKLPLGLAIIDKAYRNEISPRQMFFRLREFSQAELQIFFDPERINEVDEDKWKDIRNYKLKIKKSKEEGIKEISCEEANKKLNLPKFYIYHMAKVQQFYLQILRIPETKFRFRELGEEERAFYNKIHFDIEIDLETLGGFKEVAGIHYRAEHDLAGHQKISGKNLEVFYDNKKILAHVLELSFGVDRNTWMLLDIFHNAGKEGSMFRFPSHLAPIKAAVLPIVKGDFEKLAKEIYLDLKKDFFCVYDAGGSIGRRYARMDEVGCPMCITIDGDSLKNKDVTIRWRDNAEQIRIKITELKNIIRKVLDGEDLFKFGKRVDTRVK